MVLISGGVHVSFTGQELGSIPIYMWGGEED